LLQGAPGVGKTTFALQFLLTGQKHDEQGIYVSMSESRDELAAIAHSHGWSVDGMAIHEIAVRAGRTGDAHEGDPRYTVFHPSEIELEGVSRSILEETRRLKPQRIVIDSLSELRLLAGDPLRYRRQLLTFKEFFSSWPCTVFLLDPGADDRPEFETLAYGVISLDQFVPPYGRKRRRLRVSKLRAVNVDDGYHDFKIKTGGIVVYPRLVAADHRMHTEQELVPSGVENLDRLLGGGLTRGSSTLVMGAAGTGKSTFCTQYALSAALRGERVSVFSFDESREMWLSRAKSMNVPIRPHIDSGRVTIQTIDPGELAPNEFVETVRKTVDVEGAQVVVIDSLNGYLNATPDERYLVAQLHELLAYLSDRVVLTLLVVAQEGLIGTGIAAPVEISYLADSVVLLRYFEYAGSVRQAISCVKKRYGLHERTIRELWLGQGGVTVGEQLTQFQGVLSGMPEYHGPPSPLLEPNQHQETQPKTSGGGANDR
jgi:circadian clock protein KaiC